ncbi:MAG: hypothetical protein AMXMBFR61_19350 [Fimbriimonadales bacterium]
MISVTGLRNFLGKQMGWIMVGLSVLMLASMGLYFGRGGGFGARPGEQYVFAVIEGRKVSGEEFSRRLKAALDQAQQQAGRLTPDAAFGAYRQVVSELVMENAMLADAARQGINVDEKTVYDLFDESAKEQLAQMRKQFVEQKKLKEGASEKELLEVYRKETGRRWETVLQEQRARIDEMLKSEEGRQSLFASAAVQELQKRVMDSVKVDEATYKKGREQVGLRRILVKSVKNVDPKKRIEEVQAKLKAGEDFDKLVEQYSDEEPTGLPGQQLKKGETAPLDRTTLARLPVLKPLADKDVGYVSGIIKLGEDYAIYKITSVTPKLPDDYDKKKDFYLDQFREERRREKVQEWQRSIVLNAKVEFKEPTWQLLYRLVQYDWRASFAATPPSPKERNAQYIKLVDEATELLNSKKGVPEPAMLMRMVLAQQLVSSPDLTDLKEKERMQAVYREALTAALRQYEDANAREMLVQEYLKDKNYKAAIAQLTAMAKFAWNPNSPEDQQVHWRVQSHLSAIKAAGYKSEELAKLEETTKKFAERAREARLRQMQREEEDRKRAEEQRKRAEERRAAEAAKKKDAGGAATTERKPEGTAPAPVKPGGR